MEDAADLRSLAKMIDHSLLHPAMMDAAIRAGCDLCGKYHVAAACVKPYAVGLARQWLSGADVAVCAVIGFPHGNSTTHIKVAEAVEAVEAGAAEIDMVVNVGKVLGGDWDYVRAEIEAINDAVVSRDAILKVIFENDYLSDGHIVRLCEICSEVQVAFVKTSTGYGFVKQPDGTYSCKGATEHDLKLMRRSCSPSVAIKAAGGIRTLDALLAARSLGASRIGASATESILEEAKSRGFE